MCKATFDPKPLFPLNIEEFRTKPSKENVAEKNTTQQKSDFMVRDLSVFSVYSIGGTSNE